MWRACLWTAVLFLGGCLRMHAYEGERRSTRDVAIVAGDLRVSAGAPMSLILRGVDGQPLDLRYNSVELLPGKHQLLVDCRIAETQTTSRHVLDVELAAGQRYRLLADTGPGMRSCVNVRLESQD